ncbi:hypothetical protein CROQUDRAFT_608512 [Cronartium quercuum f. sp. fusiforme G11]|uniref:Uncharacterized protein n=1 Tax=Cronartium quercuum f. sp. fusiforme G11 TaxID=708437 RepID=A0A9P6T4T6_9BASI|nr:hypothetical protein CROQUDRAFT_608512 [Cronartium quercuum f. sp. fusiforme G11]
MDLKSYKKPFDKIPEPVQKPEFVGKDMGRSRNSTSASSFEAWTFDSDEEDNCMAKNTYRFKTRSPSTSTTALTSSNENFSHKCPTTLTNSVKKVEEAEKRKAKIKENLFCTVFDLEFQSDDENLDEEEEENDWLGTKIFEKKKKENFLKKKIVA